jgi:hypothetical protein
VYFGKCFDLRRSSEHVRMTKGLRLWWAGLDGETEAENMLELLVGKSTSDWKIMFRLIRRQWVVRLGDDCN